MKITCKYECSRATPFAEDTALLDVVMEHLMDIYKEVKDNVEDVDSVEINVVIQGEQ